MSGRGTHYAGGAFLGLTVGGLGQAWLGHWGPGATLALAITATLTGGGELSPDVDQLGWFRALDRWLPDEWLGFGGPLQHRGVTHWTAWPFLAATVWTVALLASPVLAPVWWLGYGVALGWLSHVLLDALFGHAVRSPEGMVIVRAGVPTMPWWRHRGGIFTSGGIGSATFGAVLCLAIAGQLYLLTKGGTR